MADEPARHRRLVADAKSRSLDVRVLAIYDDMGMERMHDAYLRQIDRHVERVARNVGCHDGSDRRRRDELDDPSARGCSAAEQRVSNRSKKHV